MQDHVIQKRDLIEMLKPYDETAEIVCERPGDDSAAEMTIDRTSCHARRISIHVHADKRISELEKEVEDLESNLRKATALLERFQHMQDAIGTSEELDELAVKTLIDDVAAFL